MMRKFYENLNYREIKTKWNKLEVFANQVLKINSLDSEYYPSVYYDKINQRISQN